MRDIDTYEDLSAILPELQAMKNTAKETERLIFIIREIIKNESHSIDHSAYPQREAWP